MASLMISDAPELFNYPEEFLRDVKLFWQKQKDKETTPISEVSNNFLT